MRGIHGGIDERPRRPSVVGVTARDDATEGAVVILSERVAVHRSPRINHERTRRGRRDRRTRGNGNVQTATDRTRDGTQVHRGVRPGEREGVIARVNRRRSKGLRRARRRARDQEGTVIQDQARRGQ